MTEEYVSVLNVHKMAQKAGLEVSYDFVKAQLQKQQLVHQAVKGGTMAVKISNAKKYVEGLRQEQIRKCKELLARLEGATE